MRDLPDLGTFALVTVPFRALLHLRDDGERLAVLRALRERLRPGGTLAFDVFHPDRIDIEETQGRWMEREPGIDERARWDEARRRLVLSVRADGVVAEMELWWVDPDDWRACSSGPGSSASGVTAGSTGGRSSPDAPTPSGWRAGRRRAIGVAAWTPIPSPSRSTIPTARSNRLTSAFRIFTVIPIAIVLGTLEHATGQLPPQRRPDRRRGRRHRSSLPVVLMLLFRQKYPRWWFDWNLELHALHEPRRRPT